MEILYIGEKKIKIKFKREEFALHCFLPRGCVDSRSGAYSTYCIGKWAAVWDSCDEYFYSISYGIPSNYYIVTGSI